LRLANGVVKSEATRSRDTVTLRVCLASLARPASDKLLRRGPPEADRAQVAPIVHEMTGDGSLALVIADELRAGQGSVWVGGSSYDRRATPPSCGRTSAALRGWPSEHKTTL